MLLLDTLVELVGFSVEGAISPTVSTGGDSLPDLGEVVVEVVAGRIKYELKVRKNSNNLNCKYNFDKTLTCRAIGAKKFREIILEHLL